MHNLLLAAAITQTTAAAVLLLCTETNKSSTLLIMVMAHSTTTAAVLLHEAAVAGLSAAWDNDVPVGSESIVEICRPTQAGTTAGSQDVSNAQAALLRSQLPVCCRAHVCAIMHASRHAFFHNDFLLFLFAAVHPHPCLAVCIVKLRVVLPCSPSYLSRNS